MPKQTVAVLFGGRSVEHEVSVISAHQVMDALDVAGYDVLPIFIDKKGAWFAGPGLHNLKQYGKSFDPTSLRDAHRVSLSPDLSVRQLVVHPFGAKGFFYKPPVLWADVFFPVLHGSFGEDGRLQGLFEMAGVPYVGCDVMASALGMDKIAQKEVYHRAGLPVLECRAVRRADWAADPAAFIRQVEEAFGYPLIVKPCSLGSSIGISRAANSRELTAAMETAMTFDSRVLVERALQDFREVNCSVIGPPYRASVCEMPTSKGEMLSFDDKYRSGRAKGPKTGVNVMSKGGMASLNRLIPAPIADAVRERVQTLAVQAFQAIGGSGIARVDFLLENGSDNLYVNEINTMPGSLSFYLWEPSGVSFDKLVTILVEAALARHHEQSKTRFALDVNLLGASAS